MIKISVKAWADEHNVKIYRVPHRSKVNRGTHLLIMSRESAGSMVSVKYPATNSNTAINSTSTMVLEFMYKKLEALEHNNI